MHSNLCFKYMQIRVLLNHNMAAITYQIHVLDTAHFTHSNNLDIMMEYNDANFAMALTFALKVKL